MLHVLEPLLASRNCFATNIFFAKKEKEKKKEKTLEGFQRGLMR